MHWVAPSEKDAANTMLEDRLWAAADQLRANSGLNAAQYSAPVLGLIFLRFAEVRFAARRAQLEKASASARRSGPRVDEPAAYNAEGRRRALSHAQRPFRLSPGAARGSQRRQGRERGDAIERDGSISPGSELEQWIGWALKQAQRIDPLSVSTH